MEHQREMPEQLDQEQMLDRFKTTEIFGVMMQHPKEDGDANNGDLIKLLFGKDSVFGIIRDFVNGKCSAEKSVKLFKKETEIILKRFSELNGFFEDLFNELVKIAQAIYSINQDVEEKVDTVMEEIEPELEGVEAVEIIKLKLEKGKPETIADARKITVTIQRKGKKEDHIIVVDKLKESLRVTCPTSDSSSGKKLFLEIMPDEEYVVGIASTREIERLLRKHDEEIGKAEKAQSRGEHYRIISTESVEYQKFSKLESDHKKEAKRLMKEIKSLKANPLFHWFDEEKSEDIGSEQLVVELCKDGTIVVTDDGENGETTVEVEMRN